MSIIAYIVHHLGCLKPFSEIRSKFVISYKDFKSFGFCPKL